MKNSWRLHHGFTETRESVPMKIKLALLFPLLMQAGLGLAQPPAPDLGDARVTLSYKELKSLIEAAHPESQPKPKPPVESALLAARYQVRLLDNQAEGTVKIEAQSFAGDWTAIPLIDAATQVDRTEPADARLIVREGRLALVTDHAGPVQVTLHFACPLSMGKSGLEFRLPSVPAAIRTLALSGIPQGKSAQVEGGILILGGEKGAASYRLPENQASSLVNILQEPEPPTPSRWKVESESLATYVEGKMVYRSHVSAMADGGSGLEMDLELPPRTRLVEVLGEDLQGWTVGKAVHVSWKTRNLLSRDLDLTYEIAQPVAAGDWKLQAPRVSNGENAGALFAVTGEQGMEIRAAQPDSIRLSRRLAKEAGRRNAVLVGDDGVIHVKWLPLVATTPAVVNAAKCTMRVVADGALIYEIIYGIRHEGPLAWRAQLPEGSQLLDCSLDERRVNPVERGAGVIELALDAPDHGQTTTVKFSCTARKEAFKPVEGFVDLELPRSELLIQKLDWDLQIPTTYELVTTQGNVEATAGGEGLIRLRKELCKNETPAVRIYYQKPETKKP